jgi:hypothetical protein
MRSPDLNVNDSIDVQSASFNFLLSCGTAMLLPNVLVEREQLELFYEQVAGPLFPSLKIESRGCLGNIFDRRSFDCLGI